VWSLILSDIRNPFFTEVMRGIEEIAYQEAHSLILANSAESLERERTQLRLAAAENVSGVILVPSTTSRDDLSDLSANNIAVVTLDRRVRGGGYDCVLTDHVRGSQMAVDHLVESGYRRIACIAGPSETTSGVERLNGYRLALMAHEIEPEPVFARHSNFTEAGGYEQMRALLDLANPPDAVFVANNVMTVGALRAVSDAGRRIPEDIAVLGFDEMSWSGLLNPPLSTIAQPSYDLGLEAARLLVSRLNGYDGAAREVVLTPTLHVRASSAPGAADPDDRL
jgi:LacI family transcriptional regulator